MIDTFAAKLAPLHLLQHPFYMDWMQGKITPEQLKDYAAQYYHHVAAFPRYLGAIHSQCEDATQRRAILENLNDEEGVGYDKSHPELWLQFAAGVGADEDSVKSSVPRPAIQKVIKTFFDAAHSSYHVGLGALYAYESQVPEIADSKITGLKTQYGINDAATLQFFEVHKTADVEHRQVLKDILDTLPEDKKQEAAQAAERAATALWDFLSEVHGCDGQRCAA
ncbi:MAG: CADD family putative folate metabolism protein [Alphaproteobacteria bacterium]|nr:CADD family putative folate metabolism protein [Alphaproteobacteria bacterium]